MPSRSDNKLTSNSDRSFDEEEISPRREWCILNMENTECQETTEGIGNVRGSIEERKPPCKLSSSIKCREIINDKRKERRLCHSEEPAKGKHATKVVYACPQKGEGSKTEHHNWKHPSRAVFLPQHTNWRRSKHVGDVEYRQDQVVVGLSEVQVLLERASFRISQIAFVKSTIFIISIVGWERNCQGHFEERTCKGT